MHRVTEPKGDCMNTDPPSRVVVPAEEFMARLKARDWRRRSLLQELLAANDPEELAIVRELAEADRPRRRRSRA